MNKLPSLLTGERLARLFVLAKYCPPGALMEVGVYQGGSAEVLYDLARLQSRELWLYDTFSGIPFADDIDAHKVGDFSETSYQAIRKEFPNAIIQQGIFPDGLMLPGKIAFVHLDCDQYRSYRESLDYLLTKIVPGGMIVCDDYALAGAAKAIDETKHEKEVLDNGQVIFRC